MTLDMDLEPPHINLDTIYWVKQSTSSRIMIFIVSNIAYQRPQSPVASPHRCVNLEGDGGTWARRWTTEPLRRRCLDTFCGLKWGMVSVFSSTPRRVCFFFLIGVVVAFFDDLQTFGLSGSSADAASFTLRQSLPKDETREEMKDEPKEEMKEPGFCRRLLCFWQPALTFLLLIQSTYLILRWCLKEDDSDSSSEEETGAEIWVTMLDTKIVSHHVFVAPLNQINLLRSMGRCASTSPT